MNSSQIGTHPCNFEICKCIGLNAFRFQLMQLVIIHHCSSSTFLCTLSSISKFMSTKIAENQFGMWPISAPQKKPQDITIELHVIYRWILRPALFSYKLQHTIYMKYVFHQDFGCSKHNNHSKYIRLY